MAEEKPQPWLPLRNRLFRALWIATVVSNLGTWMQQVANGWLMTSLTLEPFLVALEQVVTTLPMFMLALPGGALADLVDRRRYLLITQSWMMVTSVVMGALTYFDLMTPPLLLFTTFIMSLGVALNSPGWHAVTPEVVSREILPKAVALNGLAINGARALGPALGGLVIVGLGPAACYFLNAVSFLAVLSVLVRWKRRPEDTNAPPEEFFSAMRVGVQHVRYSSYLKAALVRASLFLVSTSALWALLPLLCRQEYGFGPRAYGTLIAVYGVGAVFGAIYVLPRLRLALKLEQIVALGWVCYAAILCGLALSQTFWTAIGLMAVGGAAWLCILANLHLVVQSSAPPWVQARAMSVYLLCFFGAASLGSGVWGALAEHVGLRGTLVVAAGTLLLSSLSSFLMPLRSGESQALEPSHAWPDPDTALDVPLRHGPVLVTVEYDIAPEDAPAFREAVEKLRAFRYQNGVLQWGIFVDIAEPTKYREIYLEDSWGAHLRHHDRVTAHETELAQEAYKFHQGPEMPPVIHYAYCDDNFPSDSAAPRPIPRSYQTTSRGIPLWFVDDFQTMAAESEAYLGGEIRARARNPEPE